MEKDLEKYLTILNSEGCLKKPKEATIILEKISNCFTQKTSEFTISLLISLVLDENNGIFTFIWKTSAELETLTCVTTAFKLLDNFVVNFQKSTQPYFPTLYQKCVFLLDAKFAKVKELSLKLINRIIVADSKQTLHFEKLVKKLEKILQEDAKSFTGVTEETFRLLSYLFEKYPESIPNEKWFFAKMLETLKQGSDGNKNPSVGKVKGAFEGINGYLTNHRPPDAEALRKTYKYIKMWAVYRENKKGASQAGLNVFQNHWRHFSSFIYDDKDFWRLNLDVWIIQKVTDRQTAFKYLCSYYSVIALHVKQESNRLEVSNYIQEFSKSLQTSCNSYEKKAALVGIKLFVLTDSLTEDEFKETYKLISNFIKKEERFKNFTYMPLCVECVSAFVLKSKGESLEQLTLLQRLSVKLIDNYPNLEKEFQPNALVALEKSFYMIGLSSCEVLEDHLNRVLYQGLIRTCSAMTFQELELLIETGQASDSVCCKSYLSLWKYVLTLGNTPNLPVGGSFSVKKGTATKAFDAFIVSFLKILSKLNFSVGPELEAETPSDLHIFINMVDLYEDLLPSIDCNNMEKWLLEVLRTVIKMSRKNPLLAGFYKIVAANLKIAESVLSDECTTEKEKCFELAGKFLEDVLAKVDHYKGDLQLVCLKVLLATPASIMEGLVEKAIPALEVISQLSRNCLSLLKDTIEALERWDLSLSPTTSGAIMKRILPHFDVFLQSPYFQGKNAVDSSRTGKKLKVDVVFNDSELLSLQKNFLMFLGNLEMSKGLYLIELPDTENRRSIEDKPLTYSLPCGRGWVEISLDEMMLRVIDLGRCCGERKTRVAACELLYSLVMVLIGNINQVSGRHGFLFRKVIETCVILGCDPDGLVWQIFEPLTYQIIHYFSGKQALHFPETEDLVEILMEGVTSPYNATVRDFSGNLLREFAIWSIKQLTPEELKTTPESVKRILERIFSLALHPSYSKRLGAAVVFNRIYSVFREEEFILDAYWFLFFYYFIESLRMCDVTDDVTEITEAIRHVERPLVEKANEFNRDSPERVVPPEFNGGRLCHLVKWTMERACDMKLFTRRTAMMLVRKLAPLVENCDSDLLFASKQFLNFFQIDEKCFHSDSNEEELIEWFKYHTAGFEYCTWLLEAGALTTEEVFHPRLKTAMKRFIGSCTGLKESSAAIDNEKQLAVIGFFQLLRALKERACLYPKEHWNLLKIAVFKPTRLGFDLTCAEELLSVLTDLLKHFVGHLNQYEWSNFYQGLESMVTPPIFGSIVNRKEVSVESLEFLFSLKVIEGSGIWETFMKNIFFSMNEDVLVGLLFKSLMSTRREVTYAAALDPACKCYLEEILKVVLNASKDLTGVMKCLENEEEAREEETEKPVKKGTFFLCLFKPTILEFLKRKYKLLIDWAVKKGNLNAINLVIEVLENQNSELALEVFLRWRDFENLTVRNKPKVLLRLAASGARAVGTPGFLKTSPVAEKVYEALENRELHEIDFSEIELIFNLLPYLSEFAESTGENNRLRDCLSRIQINLDDLKESGNALKQTHIHFALNGILQSLKTTASLDVLDFVITRADWYNAVCKVEDVESALEVFIETRTPLEHTLKALDLIYDYCFQRENSSDLSPVVIYKLFLRPMLRLVPNSTAYDFVNKNLESLCSLLSTYWGEEENAAEVLTNMGKKTSAAGVLQTFTTKLSKEELEQMPKERRQMIDGVVKNVFSFLKKPYPPRVLKKRHRKLMCEIFNMICCIVSARCVDEKFFKVFIFDERGSFLFEAIDKTATYNLEMDFEEIPKRRKHLTSLRETVARETNPGHSAKYIQTNTLFTCSLQEDVTRFDLSCAFVRPMNSVSGTTRNVEIELEMDSLNSHECMATLVATISKMCRDKITPLDDVTKLPCWLKFFLSILKNSDLCENLRLFVLKALYNVQEFVAPFCKTVLPELLDGVLKLFVNYPINYFLMDLIEMMIEWKHVPKEEKSRLQLTELVEIVLEKSDSLRRDIVKNNLEILKLMIEVWKDVMNLPQLSRTVFQRLSKSLEQDLRTGTRTDSVTYLNAHVSGILLTNGIPPWDKNEEKNFLSLVLKGFQDSKLNQVFAEVCGQALKHLERTKPESLGEYERLVEEKILSRHDSWIQLLYGVHKHYPKISAAFTFKIFSSAWDSLDSLSVLKLEMLLSHASEVEDVALDRHAGAFILDMLNSPDVGVLELSLRIAERLLHKLEKEKLAIMMKELVRLQRSTHPGVRKWVYEIGKKLYKETSDDSVPTECKVVLLRGLKDEVKELEESCLEFWREILNLTSPEVTLVHLLKVMYTPDTEDVFLANASRILLQLAEDDYQNRKELFPHPINYRCKFRKKNLVFGTRQSFLLSLSSSSRTLTNQSLENVATIRQRNLPYLRPTVSTLQFEPTVQQKPTEGEPEPSVDTTQDRLVAGNPRKRRFYKNQAKTSFFFAKKQNKQEAKTKNEIEIYGEYRDGDYPDIQIKNSQISKLLQVLTKQDHQLARLFLVSFYSGLIKLVSNQEKVTLFSKTKICFENMLKSSGNFDPGVFGFVLQVALNHCRTLDIDYQLISNAAVSSNWISLGALIIEEIIASKEGDEPGSAKRRKGCLQTKEKTWLELAKLYRSLEEMDVLSGIFLDKLKVEGSAREAILCESTWNWAEASSHYESALRADPDSSQLEFYTESYLSCLAKLSNWSAVNKCIRSAVNDNLGELWNNYYLLSWFLKSEMMISLDTAESEYRAILEEFCKNGAKRDILSANFGEEMTVFDWFSNNLQRANYRIDKLSLDFLAGWSHIDRWSYNLRAAKLATLQTLSELGFAVRSLAETSRSLLEQDIQMGVRRWEKNTPSVRDELTVWDVKLGYRREFLKRLKDFDLTTLEVKSNLALAKAALSQENLSLTKKCLNWAREKISEEDFDLKAEHNICFNMGKMVVAKLRMKDPKVGLEVYLSVWDGISKRTSCAMETDSDSFKTFMYSCNFTLGQLVSEILPFIKKNIFTPEMLSPLRDRLNSHEGDITDALREKGLNYFETAIEALHGVNCTPETKSNAYLELAKFFLKFPDPNRFRKFCEHLLKSMSLGNPEARQLFGCLLNMDHLLQDESSLSEVVSESDRVPSWMFLMWINQMLARLNSKLFPLIESVLARIIDDYPNAIQYPLKLMEEARVQDWNARSFIGRLCEITSKTKLYLDFWKSLQYLAPPDLILTHHLEEALEHANKPEPDYLQINKMILDLKRLMFSEEYAKFRGPAFKFWDPFVLPLEELSMKFEDSDALKTKLKEVLSVVQNTKLPSKRVLALLESYSPWLYNFHALRMESELELPGQYHGESRPIKKHLVTVSSFRNSIVLFDSKCRPMRISILGNDAREHKFLIKFGEDLRQDERIQQVFRHFNHRLRENKQTRRFSVDTFTVVPLTSSLGMIEWIENTVSLYEMMENCLGNDSDAIASAQKEHLSFLSRGFAPSGAVAAHLIGYEKVKRENAVSGFRATSQRFPGNLLKKSFLDLSTTPEHFMHLRGNFATSHAVACITHWLVGIGDRHLQNTLVSTKTGRVLGIDFGYAFGFATQFLTPPELLPFRMSPQILNFMHPLGESGWIKQTMIHCLRVFRKESFRLRAVLEVFAEEPVMNWLKQAKRNPNYQAEGDAWYPREKLDLVERKLGGVNPVVAFEADLRAGHSHSKYLEKYLEVLRGVERENFRARCREEELSEEEQVECLIDLATDPHVLSKTYIGWNPWL